MDDFDQEFGAYMPTEIKPKILLMGLRRSVPEEHSNYIQRYRNDYIEHFGIVTDFTSSDQPFLLKNINSDSVLINNFCRTNLLAWELEMKATQTIGLLLQIRQIFNSESCLP